MAKVNLVLTFSTIFAKDEDTIGKTCKGCGDIICTEGYKMTLFCIETLRFSEVKDFNLCCSCGHEVEKSE
jgi:hypothetical protein